MNDVPTQSITIGGAHHDGDRSEVERSDVDLSSDPFADDLTHELAVAAPKHWRNRATLVIGGLVIIVAGFLGGIQVQSHYGTTGTASSTAGPAGFGGGTFPGREGATGTGAGGASSGATTAADTTTGTIKLIDGSTIYVQLANGDVVTVKTSTKTSVSVAASSTASKLKAGQKVTVGGAADSSGNVTATTVTAIP
jgi:hypothetical protein